MANPRYPAGLLNQLDQRGNPSRRTFDADNSTALYALRETAVQLYEPNILKGGGPFRAVVLRVESTTENSTPYWDRLINLAGLTSPDFVKIRARIPEIHTGIPEPPTFGDEADYQSTFLIEMHPLFVGREPGLVVPAAGDIVWVNFADIQNFRDPVYLGPISSRHGPGTVGLGSDSARRSFGSRSRDTLGNRRSDEHDAGSSPGPRLPGATIRAVSERTRPPGFLVLHSTEGVRNSDVTRWLAAWLDRGNRGRDQRASTHFLILQDGQILHFLDTDLRAQHAGRRGNDGIGIDIEAEVGRGSARGADLPSPLLDSLQALVNSRELINYPILGHRHLSAPIRRSDPGHRFPWGIFDNDRLLPDVSTFRGPADGTTLARSIGAGNRSGRWSYRDLPTYQDHRSVFVRG